jgi:hypothetical protein
MGGASKKSNSARMRETARAAVAPYQLLYVRPRCDLLVTQRFDGIERGGFARRVKAKENSNRSTK